MDDKKVNDRLERNRNNHPVLDENQRLPDEFTEETATEITEEDILSEPREDQDVKSMYGWLALALSVISLFLIPLIFAGAGIILGFVARNREAKILGNTAIVIGIVSILFRLFLLPLI